jgi:DNA-binding NarL/FixJ family response regulator
MKKKLAAALIVTRSIPLGEGLDALLKAIPQIDVVEITKSPDKALQNIQTRKPGIILLDAVLSGEKIQSLLEKIKIISPETQRVLLVDDAQDVKWMPQHAEAILIKGVSPSAVATIVTSLLLSKGDEI